MWKCMYLDTGNGDLVSNLCIKIWTIGCVSISSVRLMNLHLCSGVKWPIHAVCCPFSHLWIVLCYCNHTISPKGSLKFHLFLKTNTISLLTRLFAHLSLPEWTFFLCVSLTESRIRALCKNPVPLMQNHKALLVTFISQGLTVSHPVRTQLCNYALDPESTLGEAEAVYFGGFACVIPTGKRDLVTHRWADTRKTCHVPTSSQ